MRRGGITLKRAPSPSFHPRTTPKVVAHRCLGAASLSAVDLPENSLPALRHSIRHGADICEIDVRLSHDGEVVVFHDATLNRASNGVGPLETRTLSELKALRLFHGGLESEAQVGGRERK
jgi:glycerophosphoryl diester phosphodiesterase